MRLILNLYPHNKDRLKILFSCAHLANGRLSYGFVIKKGRGLPEEYDILEWQWKHEQEKVGKINNAVEKT